MLLDGFDENRNGVTIKAKKIISDTQNSDLYTEDDSSAIYEMLIRNMKPVDFGYYLKRYVYLDEESLLPNQSQKP